MTLKYKECKHIRQVLNVLKPETLECADCIEIGSSWVHLRTCQSCGVTRCCDSSIHKHATKHAKSAGHHVVASAEPEERWMWCFEHELFKKY